MVNIEVDFSMFRYAVKYMIARNFDLKDVLKAVIKNVNLMSNQQLERLHKDISKTWSDSHIKLINQGNTEIVEKMYSEAWCVNHILDIIEKEQSLRSTITNFIEKESK
jgi:dissimilatory sulfite reductase (desulfoviridin) alpha/beta subunit